MIDPYFHRFIGKMLIEVNDELTRECHSKGFTLSIVGTVGNIDVEPSRLNVCIDGDSRITKIFLG